MFYCGSLVRIDNMANAYTNPVGSSYGAFVSDLKTLRGLEQRISNWKEPKDVSKIAIYEFSPTDMYNKEKWHLVCCYSVIDGNIQTSVRQCDTSMIIDGKRVIDLK